MPGVASTNIRVVLPTPGFMATPALRLFVVFVFACLAAACGRPTEQADLASRETPVASATPAPRPVRYTVCLQPLGEHDETLVAPVARAVEQAYGFATRTLPVRPLPAFAWYPARARHRADALLDHLLYDVMPDADGCHAVLAITGVDVSATRGAHEDWGVLGLAYQGGRVAVVSSFRLRRGVDRGRLIGRIAKVALHELGHVIGVPHRGDGPHCLMNDAVGAVATIDRAEGAMCAGERVAAERFLGFDLPDVVALDWASIRSEKKK